MKLIVKKVIALAIIANLFGACQESATEDINALQPEASLTKEDLNVVLEAMVVNYPINGITDNSITTQLNDDFDLEAYAATTDKPEITFPIEVMVDGVSITINTIRELKALVKGNKGKRKPKFVFPISVVLEDGSSLEIADKEALKDYLDSLDEGVKPVFVFPLSVMKGTDTVVVNNEDELRALIGKPAKGKRPHLVFPLSVVLEDGSTQEMADKNEFDAYLDTLADGVKPTFVFPITIEKNGVTIVVETQEIFDALVKRPKKGKRPEFVFPISVLLSDGTTQEIADQDALKAYHESLDKGVRVAYVFPLSIIKDGVTVVINSQEELNASCKK